MKHLDDPYAPPARQGYQAPPPMMGGGLGRKPEPPQYAQFEVGKNGLALDPQANALSEDALPPMPSWETAAKKHVLTEEEKNGVELGELDPVTGQQVPLMTGAAAAATGMPPSPLHGQSPYGVPGQAITGNGYSDLPRDHYAQNQNAFVGNGRGYGGSPAPGPGRGGPGRGYGQVSPQNFDGQGRRYGPPSPQGYEADNGFAGAAVGGYGARPFPPQPTRQNSSDSSRPLNPGRQYSDRPYQNENFQSNGPPRGPGRMASPLNNNSGFDFGTSTRQQYQSRPSPPPQQMLYGSNSGGRPNPPIQGRNDGYFGGSTAPPSYASRSPPPQEPSYPGYRPYQTNPVQGSRRSPSGGRAVREPQGWDPVHQ